MNIGQEVVCIDASNSSSFPNQLTEGKVYTIKGVRKGCCYTSIDIGNKTTEGRLRCRRCKSVRRSYTYWYDENRFAPLDHIEEVNKLLQEVTV